MLAINGETTYYIYGLGLIGEEKADTYKTYHYDYRGSTTAITDTNGNVTDRIYYDVYGNIVDRIGTTDTPYLYVGKYGVETDENGLYYMRARYYNPTIQRFVNVDPIKAGLNWYGYADGNSITGIDPTGNITVDEIIDKIKGAARTVYNGGKSVAQAVYNDASSLYNDKVGLNHFANTSVKNSMFNYAAYKAVKSKKTKGLVDASIIIGTIKYNLDSSISEFKYQTQRGNCDNIIYAAIGAKQENGAYHIQQDYWQSSKWVGYNDLYDLGFKGGVAYTGNSATNKKFTFNHNGEELILWGWKGDYINLGAGAELGIYSKSNIGIGNHYHYTTATQYALPMSIEVTRKSDGKQILYWDSKTASNPVNRNQWWITGFNAQYQNVQADDLEVTITMDCSNNKPLFNSIAYQYRNTLVSERDFNMSFNNDRIEIKY